MSRILAYKEHTWMDDITDRAMWRHLCRAYDVEVTLLSSKELIQPIANEVVVILDEQGKICLEEFVHPEECVYVFGRTLQNKLIEIPHDHSVVINYPGTNCLFGVSAASIVLADRLRKKTE